MADEVSHTKNWQRISVFIIALLFILTSGALTALVIYQAATSKSPDKTSQTAKADCVMGQVNGTVLPKPTSGLTNPDVKMIDTKDLSPGSGSAAKSGDCLTVKYYGTLASNGTMFDEDYTKPLALKFQLGQGQVIPGWDIGLSGMKVGGERRLVIAPDLAYGKTGQGAIPPNATLIFFVKLLAINEATTT